MSESVVKWIPGRVPRRPGRYLVSWPRVTRKSVAFATWDGREWSDDNGEFFERIGPNIVAHADTPKQWDGKRMKTMTEWIPGRVPSDESGRYLTTVKTVDGIRSAATARWDARTEAWLDDGENDIEASGYVIIAYAELPEPWDGEANEGHD